MMARYAEIKDGKVVNVIVADTKVAAARGLVAVTGGCGPGWSYDGSAFAPPPSTGPESAPPAPLTAEDLWTVLEAKGIVTADDKPAASK